MKIFEVHITADEKIIKAAKILNLKTIVIDLVKPDKSYFRTEYMTSQVCRYDNYSECKDYVDDAVTKLIEMGVDVKRVKIECPYYPEYKDKSLYFEIHYETDGNLYPLSKNQNKNSYLCTAREYDKTKYDDLIKKHYNKNKPSTEWVMELCLYDTDIMEDVDWFNLY
jgi:hypothetical protein